MAPDDSADEWVEQAARDSTSMRGVYWTAKDGYVRDAYQKTSKKVDGHECKVFPTSGGALDDGRFDDDTDTPMVIEGDIPTSGGMMGDGRKFKDEVSSVPCSPVGCRILCPHTARVQANSPISTVLHLAAAKARGAGQVQRGRVLALFRRCRRHWGLALGRYDARWL